MWPERIKNYVYIAYRDLSVMFNLHVILHNHLLILGKQCIRYIDIGDIDNYLLKYYFKY